MTKQINGISKKHRALKELIRNDGPFAVAVSGGVDSTTLAAVACEVNPQTLLYHAVSAAVPESMTERLKAETEKRGWRLKLIETGEFKDPQYLSNPVDRCYFCKSNLYERIAELTDLTIVSGTNLDDLSDFRPGLKAAERQSVRHPFVEVGINKADIRLIAKEMGLDQFYDLPAAPCLASRIETGLPIDSNVLPLVDRVEELIRSTFSAETVRCRVRQSGLVIETDPISLEKVIRSKEKVLSGVHNIFEHRFKDEEILFEPYVMGSAFLKGENETQ